MQQPFLGSIQYFAFNFAPTGYALCNGAQLQIAQNQALFALLGNFYGGDLKTVFNLPDLQGRTIIGQGQSTGTSNYGMGNKGGSEGLTMTTSMLPVHNHSASPTIAINGGRASIQDPTGAYPAAPPNSGAAMYSLASDGNSSMGMPTTQVTSSGGGQPVNLLSPYVALTCCIATAGIFPSRN